MLDSPGTTGALTQGPTCRVSSIRENREFAGDFRSPGKTRENAGNFVKFWVKSGNL